MQHPFFNLETKVPRELSSVPRGFAIPLIKEYTHTARVISREMRERCFRLNLPRDSEVDSVVVSLIESGTGLDIADSDTRGVALIAGEVYQDLCGCGIEDMKAGLPAFKLDFLFREEMFSKSTSKVLASLQRLREAKTNTGAGAVGQRMIEVQRAVAFAGDLYAVGILELEELNTAGEMIMTFMEGQPDVLQLISILYWRAMTYKGRFPDLGYWLDLESDVEKTRRDFPNTHSGVRRGSGGYKEEELFDELLQRFIDVTKGSPFPDEHLEDARLSRVCTDVLASLCFAYYTYELR
ncbi:hypothetical protein DFP72DRAFT_851514 [Ephemerocybe angulata]|uniref:Uncharacterized protein n=1 Tax=Ephemerocybe angulata TaxID=980116 RepID=A0A8H6HRT9_9AGAR|nr:hypothetical protein DFP72DRAFT_851514 [Tulosesus angulatus]